jgi:hypothetical protein
MDQYTAGCPMNEEVKWTYLTQEEIVEKLADCGIEVSVFIVRTLLKIHRIRSRKMDKSKTIDNVADRDRQFGHIRQWVQQFHQEGQPATSMDTKKKEPLGSLYRPGKVYSDRPLEVYDHDYTSLQIGLVVPHGIYDIFRNEALINLGTSTDTAEFVYDSLLQWWQQYGQIHYPNAKKWLIICDGGGSNNCRHYVFKEASNSHRTLSNLLLQV